MGLLESIGFILTLAVLAGFNLYLTVFLTGLAVRLDWFHWASQASALEPFAHPLVIGIALLLFLIEFGIDKIPWADSLWDSIHTFLRPAGAIFLAVTALGPEAGTFKQVLTAFGGGAAALLAHIAKAGIRLNINTSPEPYSNIIASVVKDIAVVTGFMLALNNPLAALFVFGAVVLVIAFFAPRIIRSSRTILWLIWKKLRVPAGKIPTTSGKLPNNKLSSAEEILIVQHTSKTPDEVQWAVPCVSGKVKGIRGFPRHAFGQLIALEDQTAPLLFSKSEKVIALTDCKVSHQQHFLSESVAIHNTTTKAHYIFTFHRGQADIAERLVTDLDRRIKAQSKPDPEPITQTSPD